MSQQRHFYCWLIKSKTRRCNLFGHRLYLARRVSLKNPRYLTGFHYSVKLFATKAEATEFLRKKAIAIRSIDLKDIVVARKKLFIDSKGEYDYFRNRRALR